MFDELEQAKVFRRPEDLGITIEYLNPSFLVKKPSGGHRLVTAFADVARYSKPQPPLMPDVNTTRRTITPWRYLIKTDLTQAFYQIPLSQSSLKYCGVATPFRGIPVSETALEERMCRILGATLYVSHASCLHLAGFYSSKLCKHQVTWRPCEVEALSIAAAVKFFSPFIIQSSHPTTALTDSKPCVQAIDKLCRGEFSASPRVTSFLTTVSRYQVSLQHLPGKANLPSDFTSRNAPDCNEPSCQICTFVRDMEKSLVRGVSIQDILNISPVSHSPQDQPGYRSKAIVQTPGEFTPI